MERNLSRQQLYDMIWERAVSKVAPEFGISDVALRKQCVKHAIPLRHLLGPAPRGAARQAQASWSGASGHKRHDHHRAKSAAAAGANHLRYRASVTDWRADHRSGQAPSARRKDARRCTQGATGSARSGDKVGLGSLPHPRSFGDAGARRNLPQCPRLPGQKPGLQVRSGSRWLGRHSR